MRAKQTNLLIIIAGLALLALYTRMALISSAVRQVYLYLGLFAVAFLVYLTCVFLTRRAEMRSKSIWLIIGFAVAFRAIFLTLWPSISTDFNRYVWDGRVMSAGINPYKYCPNSPHLAELRRGYNHKINYGGWKTPYPPGAQWIFGAAYRLKPDSNIPLKVIFLVCDLTTMLLILRMLAALGLPRGWVMVYAWSPLIVTELASSGHVDVLGIAAMTLALTMSVTQGCKSIAGPVGLMLSTAMKPMAIPMIPMFLRKHGWRGILIGGLLVVGLAFPFASQLQDMLATPLTMAKGTRVNTSLFNVFQIIGGWIGANRDGLAKAIGFLLVAHFAARAAFGGLKDNRKMLNSAMAAIGITLLVSPILYPWYVTWMVPFLCFSLNPGWLAFSGLVAISYLLPFHDRALWIRLVEYVPLYGLLLWACLQRRRRKASYF